MIGEHAIVLLRHPAIERAKPCLEMGERVVQLHSTHRGGEGGVRVAVHEHPVGGVLIEDRIERTKHRTGLYTVASRSDTEVHIRRRNAKVIEEHVREHRVVVLAGVHDHVIDPGGGGCLGNGGELDELGASANDADHLHVQ